MRIICSFVAAAPRIGMRFALIGIPFTTDVGHWLWSQGRRTASRIVQSRVPEVFSVDIHPVVPMGRCVFISRDIDIRIGETAMVGNDVSTPQQVTLGGTGKHRGDRHPKVRDGVLPSANATAPGNVEIGRGAMAGAAASSSGTCRRSRLLSAYRRARRADECGVPVLLH